MTLVRFLHDPFADFKHQLVRLFFGHDPCTEFVA